MKDTIQVRENLELRTHALEDAQVFFDVTRKNDAHLRKWLGWLDDDTCVADVENYIIGSKKREEEHEGIDWSIWYTGQLVGGIGIFPWDEANKKISLAYWLVEECQGMGIMSDSLKAIIDFAFIEMGIHRIEITCAVGNTKSAALPKKLGFTFEGIARESGWLYDHFVDLEVFSLLDFEWKK